MLSSVEPRGLRVHAGVLAFAIWMAIPSSEAAAFCRESIMSQPTGPCVETPGVPLLHWTRSCVTYTFNDQLFARLPMLTEAEIRAVFQAAYQTWADVSSLPTNLDGSVLSCNGRSPFLVDQAPGTTANRVAEFVYDAPNEALVVARTRPEWESLPKHDPTALAFTLLWHDTRTGEILDVDMELNTGAGRFANCGMGGGGCGGNMVDLRNTITHEAGHLLGLGHTSVRGATMTTTAIGAETEKRSLEADDIAGYCALDLPEFECDDAQCMCAPPRIFPSKRTVQTCGCRAPGADTSDAGAAVLVVLGMLAGAVRLRRRATRIR